MLSLDDPRVSKGSSTSLNRVASWPPFTLAITYASPSDPYESLTSSPCRLLSLRSNFTGSVSISLVCNPFALALSLTSTGGKMPLSSFASPFSLSFRLSSLLCRHLRQLRAKFLDVKIGPKRCFISRSSCNTSSAAVGLRGSKRGAIGNSSSNHFLHSMPSEKLVARSLDILHQTLKECLPLRKSRSRKLDSIILGR